MEQTPPEGASPTQGREGTERRPQRPPGSPPSVRALLEDPDPERRARAALTLAEAGQLLPLADLEAALADPDDAVAAAVVSLAALHGPVALRPLLESALTRARPLVQATALARLPALAAEVDDQGLSRMLEGVGAMDPPPLAGERPRWGEVARALGSQRVIRGLDDPSGVRRLGAARLMLAEGSPLSLRAVAAMGADPVDDVRRCAELARRALETERALDTEEGAKGRITADEAEPADEDLIASLARALSDPADSVRRSALAALQELPGDAVNQWVRRTLRHGTSREAPFAALAAGAIGLRAAAPEVLGRAAGTPPTSQGPYLQSLLAIGLDPDGFAEAVRAVDPSQRAEALRIAWRLGGRSVRDLVADHVRDRTGAVRIAALEVLAEADEEVALDEASRLLDRDASAAVRGAAARLLIASSRTRGAALATALMDPDPDVRATALEALPHGVAAEVADQLLTAVRDEDERVWRSAIPRLASLPGDAALLWGALRLTAGTKRDELLRSLERGSPERIADMALAHRADADPEERSLAVGLAGRAGSSGGGSLAAVEMVVDALRDPDWAVRRSAAVAMSSLRPAGAVERLAAALADPSVEVRVEAVAALGGIDDDAVPSFLISALRDPEVRVRDAATAALTRMGSRAVAGQLAAALSSPDVRRAVAEVLVRMGRAAIDPLLDAVGGSDPETSAAAARVLERLAGSEAFVRDLSSPEPDRRLRAVEALGSMGGAEASRSLLRALADPVPAVRARAATFLGRLGESAAIAPLKRMFASDPVPEVAAAAEAALRALSAAAGGVAIGGEALRVVDRGNGDQEPAAGGHEPAGGDAREGEQHQEIEREFFTE